MPKSQAVVGSVGGAMFAVFLATALMYFFSSPAHPRVVFWLMIGSGVSCGICLITWFLFRGEYQARQSSVTLGPIAVAGRDNTGAQISESIIGDGALEKILKASSSGSSTPSRLQIHSAQYISTVDSTRFKDVTQCLRDLIVDDQLAFEIQSHNFRAKGKNYVPDDPHPYERKKLRVVYSFNDGPPKEVVRLERTTLTLPQTEETNKKAVLQIPDLTTDFVRTKVVEHDGVFRHEESGVECLAVLVHNVPATRGQSALEARSVFASLIFEHGTSRTYVERACWFDHEENEIWIDVSATANILIGFPFRKEFMWESINNPNRFERSALEWNRPPLLDLEERSLPWHDGSSITVEVRVISNAIATRGTTLVHRRIRLDRHSISYHSEWIDEDRV